MSCLRRSRRRWVVDVVHARIDGQLVSPVESPQIMGPSTLLLIAQGVDRVTMSPRQIRRWHRIRAAGMNLCTPTSAVVLGGFALAKVNYGEYLWFFAPSRRPLRCNARVFLTAGAAIS